MKSEHTHQTNSLYSLIDEKIYNSNLTNNSETKSNYDDFDPIVEKIPIIINKPSEANQKIILFQFFGRSKDYLLDESIEVSMKKKSKFIELKLSIFTEHCFNKNKSESFLEPVLHTYTQGELKTSYEKLYVGKIVKKEGKKNFVLIPINYSVRLTPKFKYIDELVAHHQSQQMENNPEDLSESKVQILQNNKTVYDDLNSKKGSLTNLNTYLKEFNIFINEDWTKIINNSNDKEVHSEIEKSLFENFSNKYIKQFENHSDFVESLL